MNDFVSAFKAMQFKAHCIAIKKGWWEVNRRIGELIALMHSELSEALEAARTDADDKHLPQYKGVTVELADCIIRIMDAAEYLGLPLAEALSDKMAFNETREYRHGGKEF